MLSSANKLKLQYFLYKKKMVILRSIQRL